MSSPGAAGSRPFAPDVAACWPAPPRTAGGSKERGSAGSWGTPSDASNRPARPGDMIGAMLEPRHQRSHSSLKGWAVWAAAVAIMLLLNGIVWTLVAAY